MIQTREYTTSGKGGTLSIITHPVTTGRYNLPSLFRQEATLSAARSQLLLVLLQEFNCKFGWPDSVLHSKWCPILDLICHCRRIQITTDAVTDKGFKSLSRIIGLSKIHEQHPGRKTSHPPPDLRGTLPEFASSARAARGYDQLASWNIQ